MRGMRVYIKKGRCGASVRKAAKLSLRWAHREKVVLELTSGSASESTSNRALNCPSSVPALLENWRIIEILMGLLHKEEEYPSKHGENAKNIEILSPWASGGYHGISPRNRSDLRFLCLLPSAILV